MKKHNIVTCTLLYLLFKRRHILISTFKAPLWLAMINHKWMFQR